MTKLFIVFIICLLHFASSAETDTETTANPDSANTAVAETTAEPDSATTSQPESDTKKPEAETTTESPKATEAKPTTTEPDSQTTAKAETTTKPHSATTADPGPSESSTDQPDNELKDKISILVDKCQAVVGGTVDLLFDKTGKTKEGHCLHVCVMKMLRLVKGNGKFQIHEVLAYISQYYNGNQWFIDKTMNVYFTCNKNDRMIKAHCVQADAELTACFQKKSTPQRNLYYRRCYRKKPKLGIVGMIQRIATNLINIV